MYITIIQFKILKRRLLVILSVIFLHSIRFWAARKYKLSKTLHLSTLPILNYNPLPTECKYYVLYKIWLEASLTD